MWHWLRKNLGKKANISFAEALLFAIGLHLIILLFLLISMQGDSTLHLDLRIPPGATVVCVPSFMVPAQQNYRVGSGRRGARRGTGSVKSNSKEVAQKKTSVAHAPAASSAAVSAKSSAQNVPKNSSGTSSKSLSSGTSFISDVSAKEGKKQKGKKRSKLSEKAQVKSQEPLVSESAVVQDASMNVTAVSEAPQAGVPAADGTVEQGSPDDGMEEGDGIIYVDQETYRSHEIAQQVRKVISEAWSPPPGMRSDLHCSVKIVVGDKGQVVQAEILAKSGVAVFDMAARLALQKNIYPKSVWNKTIVVHFNKELACGT